MEAGFVQSISELLGVKDLHKERASKVSMVLTDALYNVMRVGQRLQRLGLRRQLIMDDVDYAIRITSYLPPFGFESGLRSFKYSGSFVRDVFACDDHEVELQPLIQTSLPKLPLAAILRSHWLVIDGQQPATPDNPAPEKCLSLPDCDLPSTSSSEGPPFLRLMGKTVRKTAQIQLKSTSTHGICLEQQIFFKEIMEAIMGNDEGRRSEALNALQTDCGLQALLPKFSITIAEGVRCNVAHRNLALLIYHMRVLQALSLNKNLSLERVLHEILPSILTCVLSKTLCNAQTDNHWVLREFSSKLLCNICKTYTSASVRVRVIKVLSDVFRNSNSSMTTLCAAVLALSEFGIEVIQSVLIPVSADLCESALKVVNDENPLEDVSPARKLLELMRTRANISTGFDTSHLESSFYHEFPDGNTVNYKQNSN